MEGKSGESKESGVTGLDPIAIERLRAMLPKRRAKAPLFGGGYDFAYVMGQWAHEVHAVGADGNSEPLLIAEHEIDWGDELLADVLEPGPARSLKPQVERGPGGRSRVDKQRYAALLLGVIYREYTGKAPTRHTDPRATDQADREYKSAFYKFAREAFLAIGLDPSPQAFREAVKRWEDPAEDFNKAAMRLLLWDKTATPKKSPL